MTIGDLLAVLPLIVVAATLVVTLLAIAVRRIHRLTAGLTLGGLAVAFGALFVAWRFGGRTVTPLLVIDGFGLSLMGLILVAGFVVALFAYPYLEGGTEQRDEHYLLLMTAVLGAMVLSVSNHFAAFFLGLELLGVSLYGQIAYDAAGIRGIEAGIKYFVPAAMATAMVAFGIALIYADTGGLALSALYDVAPRTGMLALTGRVLLLAGIGFKLGIVPFHWWSPEVYQGAPAPTTAFIATVSKGGVFAFFLRGAILFVPRASGLFVCITALAVVSMFVGNLLALSQQNLKRLLAYSAIAHMGYLLVTVLTLQAPVMTVAVVYLVTYFSAALSAFGVIVVLSVPGLEAESIEDYRGLYWRRPGLAVVLTLAMLSMAGIPFTAGFIGKFLLLAIGVDHSLWGWVFAMIASSVIGLYYYFKWIATLFASQSDDRVRNSAERVIPWSRGTALAGLTILMVWIGVYPAPLLRTVDLILAIGP